MRVGAYCVMAISIGSIFNDFHHHIFKLIVFLN